MTRQVTCRPRSAGRRRSRRTVHRAAARLTRDVPRLPQDTVCVRPRQVGFPTCAQGCRALLCPGGDCSLGWPPTPNASCSSRLRSMDRPRSGPATRRAACRRGPRGRRRPNSDPYGRAGDGPLRWATRRPRAVGRRRPCRPDRTALCRRRSVRHWLTRPHIAANDRTDPTGGGRYRITPCRPDWPAGAGAVRSGAATTASAWPAAESA